MRRLILSLFGALFLSCQQPAVLPAPHPVVQSGGGEEEPGLEASYPGLRTLSETFPEGSLTIDVQDAASLGTLLLLASVDQGYSRSERGYDLERLADGRIVLSFLAKGNDTHSYFVQLECNNDQAAALRKRPSRLALSTIFRLTSASTARPNLEIAPTADEGTDAYVSSTVGLYQASPRILRGTLIAVSPF